jgi:diacylglycerol O-acyltransferase / wax synthase
MSCAQTGVTNVPGPQHALQTLDRRLLQSYPFVPVIGNVRISIAIFSYDGGMFFGVTADYDSSNDIGILTGGIETAAAQLLELSGAVSRSTRSG